MAKRYGRNQKRKHREWIADLQQRNNALTEAYWLQCGMRKWLENQVGYIIEILEKINPYLPVFPPKQMVGQHPAPSTYNVPILEMPKLFDPPPSAPLSLEEKILRLHELRPEIERNAETLSWIAHLIYREQAVHYYVSELAFATTPTEVILQQLVPKMAEQLLTLLRERVNKK